MRRVKLSRERLRVLRILSSGEPVALIERRGVDRRVVQSLERWTLIRPVDDERFTLTPTGAHRLAQYRPRQRSGMRQQSDPS